MQLDGYLTEGHQFLNFIDIGTQLCARIKIPKFQMANFQFIERGRTGRAGGGVEGVERGVHGAGIQGADAGIEMG